MIAWLIAICVGVSAQAANVGEYRGHIAARNLLAERILEPNFNFSFQRYLGEEAGLLDLLGKFDSRGNNDFQNGHPNGTNMLLWYLTLEGVSRDIGRGCVGQPPLLMQPYVRALLSKLCTWPSADATSDETLRAYWLALISYDAPEEEYLAWRDFFLGSSYLERPADEAVRALTLAALFNPHFLLRK